MKKLPLYVFKAILIGEPAVGKTSLVKKYVTDKFSEEYKSTMGANIYLKTLELEDQTKIKFTIWDLAGQQRFDAVREVYYKGCVGALLVYDVTRPDSYFNTPKWINELWAHNGRGRIPIVVVANKIDMRELSDDTVSPEQGRVFTERLTNLTKTEGFDCHYIETSAKTGVNIGNAFALLGTNVMRFVEGQRKTSRLKAAPHRTVPEQKQI